MSKWQDRIRRLVADLIARKDQRFGRAYATFLASQVMALDAAFGPSRARTITGAKARRNPYRGAVHLMRSFGRSEREIATTLFISPSAVHRLLAAGKAPK